MLAFTIGFIMPSNSSSVKARFDSEKDSKGTIGFFKLTPRHSWARIIISMLAFVLGDSAFATK